MVYEGRDFSAYRTDDLIKTKIRDNYFVWTHLLEEYLCHASLFHYFFEF